MALEPRSNVRRFIGGNDITGALLVGGAEGGRVFQTLFAIESLRQIIVERQLLRLVYLDYLEYRFPYLRNFGSPTFLVAFRMIINR